MVTNQIDILQKSALVWISDTFLTGSSLHHQRVEWLDVGLEMIPCNLWQGKWVIIGGAPLATGRDSKYLFISETPIASGRGSKYLSMLPYILWKGVYVLIPNKIT